MKLAKVKTLSIRHSISTHARRSENRSLGIVREDFSGVMLSYIIMPSMFATNRHS